MKTALRCLALALSLCFTPALAQARAGKAAATDDATRAREVFQAAQKLYKQGRFAEAIARFEEALALKPHPVIHYNIARCYEQLDEPARALRSFRDYLRLSPDAKDKQAVNVSISGLERKLREKGLQQLLVLTEPEGARVEVDGKDLGRSPASIELVAGEHRLVVTSEGYETVSRTFSFSTARSSEQSVTLVKGQAGSSLPPPPPPPMVDAPRKEEPISLNPAPSTATGTTGVAQTVEPAKKGKVFTWVATGVAVAAAGAGVGLYFASQGQSASLRDGTVRSRADADALVSGAQGLDVGSKVSYGVAGAAAITALILLFVEGN